MICSTVFNGQHILGNFFLFLCQVFQYTLRAWQRDCSTISSFNSSDIKVNKNGQLLVKARLGPTLKFKMSGIKPQYSKWLTAVQWAALWQCWTWHLCGNLALIVLDRECQPEPYFMFQHKIKLWLDAHFQNVLLYLFLTLIVLGFFFVILKLEKECFI